ncbi:MAG: hypothetical protein ABI220_01000 [Candidatus Saccharimonadales bacterium]
MSKRDVLLVIGDTISRQDCEGVMEEMVDLHLSPVIVHRTEEDARVLLQAGPVVNIGVSPGRDELREFRRGWAEVCLRYLSLELASVKACVLNHSFGQVYYRDKPYTTVSEGLSAVFRSSAIIVDSNSELTFIKAY